VVELGREIDDVPREVALAVIQGSDVTEAIRAAEMTDL